MSTGARQGGTFRGENKIEMKMTRKKGRMKDGDKAWKMTDVKSVRE